jgi:hypothetical protein
MEPLASVAAMNDEGNSVVFSTGDKIQLERVGETFEMVLKTKKLEEWTKKDLKWTQNGGKKFVGMELDANHEGSENDEGDEELARRVERGKEGEAVFRRRVLERNRTPRRGSIIRPKK